MQFFLDLDALLFSIYNILLLLLFFFPRINSIIHDLFTKFYQFACIVFSLFNLIRDKDWKFH